MRRVLIIQTTTHDPAVSTSWAMGWEAAKWIKKYDPSADIRVIDANKLHIVENRGSQGGTVSVLGSRLEPGGPREVRRG